MITSTLSNLHWYKIISPNFKKAIEYVLAADFADMDPGKYVIDGDNVFVIVNEYTTRPLSECDPESHRDYTDIQIMIAGIEKFGYAPLIDQVPTTPFDLENDLALYTMEEEELKSALNLPLPASKKPRLSLEAINQAVDESIAEITLKWHMEKKPKKERKAFKIWRKFHSPRHVQVR